MTKPLALLGMGAAVLAGFFHYTRVGPIRVEEEDDRPSSASPWCIRSILRCMWSIPRSRDPDRAAPFAGRLRCPLAQGVNDEQQRDRTLQPLAANQSLDRCHPLRPAALSGLALFHPALFGLSGLFGGGTWTRILHPFIGVAMFVFFLWLAIRFAGHNRIEARDRQWLRQINDVVHNREEKLPEVGR